MKIYSSDFTNASKNLPPEQNTALTMCSGDWFALDEVIINEDYQHEKLAFCGISLKITDCGGEGTLHIRFNSIDGEIIGSIKLADGLLCGENMTCSCTYTLPEYFENASYIRDLYITAEGDSAFFVDVVSVTIESFFHAAREKCPPIDISVPNSAIAFTEAHKTGYKTGSLDHYYISHVNPGAWLYYKNVDFYKPMSKICFCVAAFIESDCYIKVYIDSIESDAVCQCGIENTNDYENFQTFKCDIPQITGIHNLYFLFTANRVNLDSFWFE